MIQKESAVEIFHYSCKYFLKTVFHQSKSVTNTKTWRQKNLHLLQILVSQYQTTYKHYTICGIRKYVLILYVHFFIITVFCHSVFQKSSKRLFQIKLLLFIYRRTFLVYLCINQDKQRSLIYDFKKTLSFVRRFCQINIVQIHWQKTVSTLTVFCQFFLISFKSIFFIINR